MNRLTTPARTHTRVLRLTLLLAPAILLAGLFSGILSNSGEDNAWFAALAKPALYPPPILFPIVWTTLYLLMGGAFALVVAALPSPARRRAIIAFLLQFAFNLAWAPAFFAAHEIGAALAIILALDVALIVTIALFARIDRRGAWLLAPYLAWVLFATGLNWQLLLDNPAMR